MSFIIRDDEYKDNYKDKDRQISRKNGLMFTDCKFPMVLPLNALRLRCPLLMTPSVQCQLQHKDKDKDRYKDKDKDKDL